MIHIPGGHRARRSQWLASHDSWSSVSGPTPVVRIWASEAGSPDTKTKVRRWLDATRPIQCNHTTDFRSRGHKYNDHLPPGVPRTSAVQGTKNSSWACARSSKETSCIGDGPTQVQILDICHGHSQKAHLHVYWRPMPILASADPRAWHEEGVADPRAQSLPSFGRLYLPSYESAPDSTPCPHHVERLRSTCPWSTAVGE